ncbi:PLP-dependent aminotransferase family protein [Kiloniella laminariae]|uniref:MocR-like pyridoxine biosynthesis transcription factor PdxR n=1 Tax=Kiloniella laminariae TaxID=454162 RepID=UPI000360BD45|nr:PLP-dependent aminotransferase family protein [Kiloniella laminariae]
MVKEDVLPLQRQLYVQIRDLVLKGRLLPGERLPSTRFLAKELSCSRNTVLGAFDLLFAEGYLEGQTGSGTFVSGVLPEDLGTITQVLGEKEQTGGVRSGRGLSKRGLELAAMEKRVHRSHRVFAPGMTDLDSFPFPLWARSLARTWRYPKDDVLRNPDPCGYAPLRKTIADHLRAARGLQCDWRQIMITSGSQQAVDLMARVLLDSGDQVWFEEPGYPGLRGPLHSAGVTTVPVPVDAEGLSVKEGRRLAPSARMAVVSPSHQYPLGVVMSLRRRLELLDWAMENDSWVLEDDYDSEFRFSGNPLSSLQGLEAERLQRGGQAGRVVYLGSFSKVLFHVLRLGYVVVPEDLVDSVAAARALLDDRSSLLAQPALADFMAEGHFSAHIRRMRRLYAERQICMLENIRHFLPEYLEVEPDEAGLHLTAFLSDKVTQKTTDREIVRRADQEEISLSPLSLFYAVPENVQQGLMMGYGACNREEIEQGCQRLADIFKKAVA